MLKLQELNNSLRVIFSMSLTLLLFEMSCFFPGILEREQEQSVVYGSVDFGKTVVTHEKYKELVGFVLSQILKTCLTLYLPKPV